MEEGGGLRGESNQCFLAVISVNHGNVMYLYSTRINFNHFVDALTFHLAPSSTFQFAQFAQNEYQYDISV